MTGAARRRQEPGRVRILYLAANPESTERLALGREAREIAERITAALHRDSIDFVPCWAVRPEDLTRALLRVEPHVVHFSGHGTRREEIVLQGTTSDEHLVEGWAVADLVATLKDSIRVVVLSACHSERLARTIADSVGCAIGMRGPIDDEAATVFAAAFYEAIAFRRSIDVAFKLGLGALSLHGLTGAHAPVLATRGGVEASEVILVPEVQQPSRPSRGQGRGSYPPPGPRLHESMPGDWSVDIHGYQGFARVSAQLSMASTGGFRGRLSGAVEGLFVDGRWRILDGDQLEMRGLLFMSGSRRLATYAAQLRFSSMQRDVMHCESIDGERMIWRRC